ncbi:unnamed protein product [Camellia sinensis]
MAAGSFKHHGMRYSTTVPNYPDTHEDFMPTNKLQNSDLSLKDIVEQDVNGNHVMIYIKGVPDLPWCGFSSLAWKKNSYVPLSARNILEDPELKNAVKSFSATGARFHRYSSRRSLLEDQTSFSTCTRLVS